MKKYIVHSSEVVYHKTLVVADSETEAEELVGSGIVSLGYQLPETSNFEVSHAEEMEEHIHNWVEAPRDDEDDEQTFNCPTCGATKDSDGGVIEY